MKMQKSSQITASTNFLLIFNRIGIDYWAEKDELLLKQEELIQQIQSPEDRIAKY